jgi:hypothetical protein
MPTRITSQNADLRQGFSDPSAQQTSSRTRFRRSVGEILVPLASRSIIKQPEMREGLVVSRLSETENPALTVCAANLSMDSTLARSRKFASESWKEQSLNLASGIATAEPGKSHCKGLFDSRTFSDTGDDSNTSKRMLSTCTLMRRMKCEQVGVMRINILMCYSLVISTHEQTGILGSNMQDKQIGILVLELPKRTQK